MKGLDKLTRRQRLFFCIILTLAILSLSLSLSAWMTDRGKLYTVDGKCVYIHNKGSRILGNLGVAAFIITQITVTISSVYILRQPRPPSTPKLSWGVVVVVSLLLLYSSGCALYYLLCGVNSSEICHSSFELVMAGFIFVLLSVILDIFIYVRSCNARASPPQVAPV